MKYLILLIVLNSCLGQFWGNVKYPKTIAMYSSYQEFDSSKYYWRKQIYWEKKRDAEVARINKQQYPKPTRNMFRYDDSCMKYKNLLEKLKSK